MESDYLWKIGVERLMRNEPETWGRHLSRRLQQLVDVKQPLLPPSSTPSSTATSTEGAISYRQVFKDTLLKNVVITLPFMYDFTKQGLPETGIQIGEEFDVYVSQPQQQAFICTLMEEFSALNPSYQNGDQIVLLQDAADHHRSSSTDTNTAFFSTCPTFAYLNEPLLDTGLEREEQPSNEEQYYAERTYPLTKIGAFAPKVQVRECLIYPDNSVHVRLMPVSYVRIHGIYERPNTDSMVYDAKVSNFNRQENKAMVVKQRQESEKSLFLVLSVLESLNVLRKKIMLIMFSFLCRLFEKVFLDEGY